MEPSHPFPALRVLLLGGTQDARMLADALAHEPAIDATYALAGATRTPRVPSLAVRIGGFGGADGLRTWLGANRIGAVIDATHPFAAQISTNAARACAAAALPLLRLTRPAWQPGPDDLWHSVPDLMAAARALGPVAQRVLLTTGRKDLAPFRDLAPHHHYVIRTIDPPEPGALPPHAVVVGLSAPVRMADEIALMQAHETQVLVTKNAGAGAVAPKLEAARRLGVRVVMVERPPLPPTTEAADVADVLHWLRALRHEGTDRSV